MKIGLSLTYFDAPKTGFITIRLTLCIFSCSLGTNAFSRAYINFLNYEDVASFRDKFDGYVFVDGKGKLNLLISI